MIICGVKVSHDGAVAIIDGQRLIGSIELEKLANGRRYAPLGDLSRIAEILDQHGLRLDDVDQFVVDGWWSDDGKHDVHIATAHEGRALSLPVAPYVSEAAGEHPRHRFSFPGIPGGPLKAGYCSYAHATQHVVASYCTSPFAELGEDAFVLAWDGGMLPRLHRVSARPVVVEYRGPLFGLVGDVFVEFCMRLDPFYRDTSTMTSAELDRYHLEIPGKAMAYAALGTAQLDAFPLIDKAIDELTQLIIDATIGGHLADRLERLFAGLSSADLIATFQEYLGRLLVDSLRGALAREGVSEAVNLCLAGGCALNIKWNSMLRGSGMFTDVWVPPFPNDAGAALGTACCEMVQRTGDPRLQWDVYSGPDVAHSRAVDGWTASACDESALAHLLHVVGMPVVVLDGRAELGPRALGNRSILAPATHASMRRQLNLIKDRADYRPIAPICLESRASEVFDPGGSDRFMLFDHAVRPGWVSRVPAVQHLDGSARLQTIAPDTVGTRVGQILMHYERLSGIPVLCNTSANLSGHGFFPDVRTATRWGRTPYVWSAGILYTNATRPL